MGFDFSGGGSQGNSYGGSPSTPTNPPRPPVAPPSEGPQTGSGFSNQPRLSGSSGSSGYSGRSRNAPSVGGAPKLTTNSPVSSIPWGAVLTALAVVAVLAFLIINRGAILDVFNDLLTMLVMLIIILIVIRFLLFGGRR